MDRLRRHLKFGTWLALMLTVACAASMPAEPLPPRHVPAPAPPPLLPPPPRNDLYAPDEALRDVLSGELQYLGTGRWPGVERARACAFRNNRVLIVNVYCTLIEVPAFRIEVYSPERGRVRIYAEANGPVSARNRRDYFTFMAESGPLPGLEAHMRPLALTLSYPELRDYEQRRYDAHVPSCYGGEQHQRQINGCLGTLASRQGEWVARNRAFLERPNDDWYRVIGQMRSLAALYGRHEQEPGGM